MPTHRPTGTITVADGASVAIDLTAYYDTYYVIGTDTLTTNWAITGTGSLYLGMRIRFEYRGTVTLGGNHITFLGTQMPDAYASKKVNVDCFCTGSAWIVDYTPAFDEADIISTAMILDDNITTAKILDANVTLAKIEALTAAYLIVGNASARPTAVALTGDIAITNAGVASIAADVIVDADIKTTAAITHSKLAAFSSFNRVVVSGAAGTMIEALTTTTEVEYLNAVTPGTAAASKVAILGANKNLDTLVLPVSGLYIGAGAGTAVTSSAAEMNILTGATLNVTELNYLDNSVPGTAVASKVLTLGASKDVDTLDITTLKVAGTTITATAAQINYLATATSDIQTQLDAKDGSVETFAEISAPVIYTAATLPVNLIINTSAGAVQATLPLLSTLTLGRVLYVSEMGGAGAATIAANASDDIVDEDGAAGNATYPVGGTGQSMKLVYTAANTWSIVMYTA